MLFLLNDVYDLFIIPFCKYSIFGIKISLENGILKKILNVPNLYHSFNLI